MAIVGVKGLNHLVICVHVLMSWWFL